MKKLRLQIDDLRIDSFQMTSPEPRKGTVLGEQLTLRDCPNSCMDYGTCCYSCAATCHGSCPPGTCYQTCQVEGTCYMAAC